MIIELEQIKKDVEKLVGIPLETDSRKQPFIYYKQMYMKLAVMFSNQSYEAIGGLINRDHATVTHAKRVFEWQLPYSLKLREDYAALIYKYTVRDGIVVKNVDLLKRIVLA